MKERTIYGCQVSLARYSLNSADLQYEAEAESFRIRWFIYTNRHAHKNIKITPAALMKLSAMRLRRGWPRSKKPPLSKVRSSSSKDLVSKLLLLLIFLIFASMPKLTISDRSVALFQSAVRSRTLHTTHLGFVWKKGGEEDDNYRTCLKRTRVLASTRVSENVHLVATFWGLSWPHVIRFVNSIGIYFTCARFGFLLALTFN